MDDIEKRYRYAWDWFEYHAKQRLTTFNFFLIIMGAMGYVYIFAPCGRLNDVLMFWLSLSGAGISFLFLLLEVRNTMLVDDGRDQLDKLESEAPLNKTAIRRSDLKKFFLVPEDENNHGNNLFRRAGYVLSSHTLCLRLILSASVLSCLYIAFHVKNCLDWYCHLLLWAIFLLILIISIKNKAFHVIFSPEKLKEKLEKVA